MTDLRDQYIEVLTAEHYRRAEAKIKASPEEHSAAMADVVLTVRDDELKRLREQLDDARQKVAELREYEVGIKSLTTESGAVEMDLHMAHDMMRAVVSGLIKILDEEDAPNYVEMEFKLAGTIDRYTVTIRRPHGKTPGEVAAEQRQLAQQVEREREAASAELSRVLDSYEGLNSQLARVETELNTTRRALAEADDETEHERQRAEQAEAELAEERDGSLRRHLGEVNANRIRRMIQDARQRAEQIEAERDTLQTAIKTGDVARFAVDVHRLVGEYSNEERGIIALTPFEASLDQLCLEKYGFNLDQVVAHQDVPTDPLHTAIECVLLDYANEIICPAPDPNLSELAYVYRQRTGWTVEAELAADDPDNQTGEPAKVCEDFRWIGQSFAFCDGCGRPAWEHRGMYVVGNPFIETGDTVREWEPGEIDALRAKWDHGHTWDPHPFVQSRTTDNVGVCICGRSVNHNIHSPEAAHAKFDVETTPDS